MDREQAVIVYRVTYSIELEGQEVSDTLAVPSDISPEDAIKQVQDIIKKTYPDYTGIFKCDIFWTEGVLWI